MIASASPAISDSDTGCDRHFDAATLESTLVARGIVNADAMARARLVRDETGDRLEAVLTRLGLVEERALGLLLSELSGLGLVDAQILAGAVPTSEATARFLRDQRAVVLGRDDDVVRVAFATPMDERHRGGARPDLRRG
jgi:general secretion pathway protein E